MRDVLLSPIEKETALQGLPACIGQPSDRLIHQDAADRVAKAEACKMLAWLEDKGSVRETDGEVDGQPYHTKEFCLVYGEYQALKEILKAN